MSSISLLGYEIFAEKLTIGEPLPKQWYIKHNEVDRELHLPGRLHIVISNVRKHNRDNHINRHTGSEQ
jgi:hypothetical protein